MDFFLSSLLVVVSHWGCKKIFTTKNSTPLGFPRKLTNLCQPINDLTTSRCVYKSNLLHKLGFLLFLLLSNNRLRWISLLMFNDSDQIQRSRWVVPLLSVDPWNFSTHILMETKFVFLHQSDQWQIPWLVFIIKDINQVRENNRVKKKKRKDWWTVVSPV